MEHTLQQKNFKEQYPQKHRPEITDLKAFGNANIYNLFRDFAEYLLQKYALRFGIPLWTETYGWTYRIGKSGVYLVRGIHIEKTGFIVNGIKVNTKEKYFLLLEHMEEIYQQNKEDFFRKIEEKNLKQAERNKSQTAREKKETASIQPHIIPNQIPRSKLRDI